MGTKCPQCGAEIAGSVCDYCGYQIQVQSEQPIQRTATPQQAEAPQPQTDG